ncbi:2221_t:CDS:2, partial [Racocetra persica]
VEGSLLIEEENTSLSFFVSQLYNKSFLNPITRSNSPVSESRSTTDNEIYDKPTPKKTKLSQKDKLISNTSYSDEELNIDYETDGLAFDDIRFLDAQEEEEEGSKKRKININIPTDTTNIKLKIKNTLYNTLLYY